MSVYSFGEFLVDAAARRVTRGGDLVPIPERHLGVLLQLLSHAGSIVSKDALVEAVWRDLAVTDNSLEQAISSLRRVIGPGPDDEPYIQTVPRQGYRFRGAVTRTASRASDASLDDLLAPHRAWIEGRAALETLERDQIVRARGVFERVLGDAPDQASAHVGLANACVMQFEMTRVDELPDVEALRTAGRHAREACRLEPAYGEAWATLGFVLDRAGDGADALAASRRAISLEPDNWRHHLRLAYVSWGEERLRAAHRTLVLLPGFPMAHWLAATVHVARHSLDEAAGALAAGIVHQEGQAAGSRFGAVALHWLIGLVHLARGDEDRALASFERELSSESSGHLYARECGANTWYAIGALRLRQSRIPEARVAFANAVERVPRHPLARIAQAALVSDDAAAGSHAGATRAFADRPGVHLREGVQMPGAGHTARASSAVDEGICRAVKFVFAGAHADAASVVDEALANSPAGSAGWLLPIEPLLRVEARRDVWAQTLARLRSRAA